MKILKKIGKIFCFHSLENKYMKEFVPFVIITIGNIVILLIANKLKCMILLRIIVFVFLYQLYTLVYRLTDVSKRKEYLRYKNGDIKFNFSPRKIEYTKILYLIKIAINSRSFNSLYLKSTNGNRFLLEFTTIKRRINEVSRQTKIYFDLEKIDSIKELNSIFKINSLIDENGFVEVEAITGFENPKKFEELVRLEEELAKYVNENGLY